MYDRRSKSPLSLILMLLFAPLILAACDLSGLGNINGDNYGLLIELEEIDTPVLVTVHDAESGALVKGDVRLVISGQDASVVVDAYSDATTSFAFDGGRLAFGIQNGATPTAGAPVRFTIQAEADGYLATSVNVRLTEMGEHAVDLYLIQPHQPPRGTAVQQDHSGRTAGGGATTASVTVTTAPEAETQASASAVVAQGTTFITRNGAPLNGNLTTTLTYYNNVSEGAVQSLPGVTNALAVTGSGTVDALLRPAGAVSLHVADAAGHVAAGADTAVDFTIEINDNTLNPSTGARYRAGDAVGLWSFDREVGAWRRAGSAVLTRMADGRLAAHTAGTSQKTTSQAGLLGGAVVAGAVVVENEDDQGNAVATCSPTFTFNRNGNAGLLPVKITGSASAGTTLADGVSTWAPGDFLETDVVDVKVYRPEGKQVFASIQPCSGATTFDLTPATSDVITVDADATLTCSTGQMIISDAAFQVTYERTGGAADAFVPILIPKSKVEKHFEDDRLSGLSLSLDGIVDGATYLLAGTVLDVSVEREETAAAHLTFDFEIDDPDVCQ